MGKAVVVQGAYWFRNNDGNEAAATFMGAQGSDQSINAGDIFRLRFVVEETAGGAGSPEAGLQYSYEGGTYTDVTGVSTHVVAADEGQGIADDAALASQRLTYSGTFVSGRYDDDGVDTTAVAINTQFTEFEFSMQVVTAAVNNGDTLDFRVYDAAVAITTYSVTPRLTVVKSAATRVPRSGVTIFQIPSVV